MSSSRGVPATETWLMATGGDGQYIDKLQGETERKRLLGALQKSIKDLVRIGFDREGPFTEQDGGVEEFCRAAMECLSHRVKDTLKDSGLVLPLVVFDQIAISTQKGGSGKKKGGVFDNIRSFSVDDFSAKLRQQQPDAAASLARERLSRGDVSGANLTVLRFFWKLLNERLFSHALEAYLSEKPFLERTYAQSSLLTDYESRMLILSILPTLDQLAFAIDTAFDPNSDPHSSSTPSSSAYDKAFPAATVSLSAPSTPQPSSARARRKRRPKKVATIDSEVQQIKCEACGEPLRSGWKLCPSCGEVCAPIVVSQPPSSIAPALPLDSSGPILDPDPLASSPPSLLSRIVGIGAQPSSPLSASPTSSGLTSSSLFVASEPDVAPPVDAGVQASCPIESPSLLSRIVGSFGRGQDSSVPAPSPSDSSASPSSDSAFLLSSTPTSATSTSSSTTSISPTAIPNSPNLPVEHLLLTASCLPTLGNLSSDSNPTAITAVAASDLQSPPPISQPISIPLPPVPSAVPPSLPLPSSSLSLSLSPPQPSSPTNLSPPPSASSPSSSCESPLPLPATVDRKSFDPPPSATLTSAAPPAAAASFPSSSPPPLPPLSLLLAVPPGLTAPGLNVSDSSTLVASQDTLSIPPPPVPSAGLFFQSSPLPPISWDTESFLAATRASASAQNAPEPTTPSFEQPHELSSMALPSLLLDVDSDDFIKNLLLQAESGLSSEEIARFCLDSTEVTEAANDSQLSLDFEMSDYLSDLLESCDAPALPNKLESSSPAHRSSSSDLSSSISSSASSMHMLRKIPVEGDIYNLFFSTLRPDQAVSDFVNYQSERDRAVRAAVHSGVGLLSLSSPAIDRPSSASPTIDHHHHHHHHRPPHTQPDVGRASQPSPSPPSRFSNSSRETSPVAPQPTSRFNLPIWDPPPPPSSSSSLSSSSSMLSSAAPPATWRETSPQKDVPLARRDTPISAMSPSVDDMVESFEKLPSSSERTVAPPASPKPQQRLQYRVDLTIHERGTPADQNNRCADCNAELSSGFFFSRTRYCEYTGKYFCDSCHTDDRLMIPSRMLLKWDIKAFSVSLFAKRQLDTIREKPLFNILEINRRLYKEVPEMSLICLLRQQLKNMHDYIATCRRAASSKKLQAILQKKTHLFTSVHVYSYQDLQDIPPNVLFQYLQVVYQYFYDHILGCEICSQRGSVCEVCRDPKPIYGFQLKVAMKCQRCGQLFHRSCYKPEKCPRCIRNVIRANAAGSLPHANSSRFHPFREPGQKVMGSGTDL